MYLRIMPLCYIKIRIENVKFTLIIIEKIFPTNKNDLSIVEEDYGSQGISKSIKNFNDNVRLINKSIEHYI